MKAQEAYRNYRAAQVRTASQGELIVMLYDGAIRYVNQAQRSMAGKGTVEEAHRAVVKAQDIISELMASLNLDTGEVAEGLFQLYEYMNHRLMEADIQKQPQHLQEVMGMLQELREAWAQVSAEEKVVNGGARYANAVSPMASTVMRLSLET